MFNFFGNRSSRRARAASSSRTSARQLRRRRLCGVEQLEDRSLMAINIASNTNLLVQGNADSEFSSASADGRYVVFQSDATNLVAADGNAASDIFLKDTLSGAITRVSTAAGNVEANGNSFAASISADGRYVAFSSDATNLVTGDTNASTDIFLKDTLTGAITRLSTDSGGVQGNNNSFNPAISADGLFVVFSSDATNFVSGGADSNNRRDIFKKNIATGATTRISTSSTEIQGNDVSDFPILSADGRYVAFSSIATNLVAVDGNASYDVFVKDTQLGTLTRFSTDSTGAEGNGNSYATSLTADGRFVAFHSDATNLVAGDSNGFTDVFLKNTQTGVTTRLSTDSTNGQANGNSYSASLSADGRYVVFSSDATNLVAADANGFTDIFFKDTQGGAVTRLSTDIAGVEGNSNSVFASLSANGRYVVFTSSATNLVAVDANAASDIFHVFTPITSPSVTSPTQTNIVATSATLGGNVTNDNGGLITERGILISKTADNPNPTLAGVGVNVTKITSAGTTGVFTVSATGLVVNTQYSFVAYATNAQGTTYTTPVSTFTTQITAPTVTTPTQTAITATTATLGGNVTADNGAAITERGVLLSKTSVNNNPILGGTGVTKITSAGTTGVFTVGATGLDPAIGYSFVAYATNAVGTTYTTPVSTFTTLTAAPTVTSPTVTSITNTGATLGGNVTADNGAAITARGIVYALTSVNNNPQLGGVGVTVVTDAATTTGVFTENITTLTPGEAYSFVAYATNSVGTTYTTPVSTFSTLGNLFDSAAAPVATVTAGSPVELGVQFRSTTAGFINSIRLYKTTNDAVSQQVSLWSSAGVRVATATATLTGSGWQEVKFNAPVPIQANQTYTASYFAANGKFGYDWNYFNTPHVSAPLTATNSVYRYGATSAFPTLNCLNSNYWVDVTFITALPTTPSVVSTTPINGATNVGVNSDLTVQFNIAMDATTITNTTVVLKNNAAVVVPATVTYDAATKTATLTPTASLATAATYTLTVVSGAAGVKATGGPALAADYVTTFITANVATRSLWETSVTPDNFVTAGSAVELGTQFQSTSAGNITGIRFFKSSGENVSQKVTLWSSTGTVLATATANLTGSGWKEVFFAAPVAITANTTYTASYFAAAGKFAYEWNYFDIPYINGPLTATKGVYRYGAASAFPTASFLNSNYWVDVIFV